MEDKVSEKIGEVTPSFTGKWKFANLQECLPDFITKYLKLGLWDFEKKMPGFALGDGVLTGVEMRTSAPVRLVRNDKLESLNVQGLYPAGEGAGYAGGIVSAAVDGIRSALAVLNDGEE